MKPPQSTFIVTFVYAVATVWSHSNVADAFTLRVPSSVTRIKACSTNVYLANSIESRPNNDLRREDNDDDENEMMSDEELLRQTPKSQLADLCKQFSVDPKGTKAQLLQRLRDFATEQTEKERERLEKRRKRVEEGGEDERERFEILDGGDEFDDESDEICFYYPSLDKTANTSSVPSTNQSSPKKVQAANSRALLTAPPPPPIEPNENGERVVTVYSTTDQNDLTGIAAAQPGQAAINDPMVAGALNDSIDAPWDVNNPQKKSKESATTSELEAAKAEVSELVQGLLAMSGAPGFQQDDDDGLSSLMGGFIRRPSSAFTSPEGFVGFDPGMVPAEMLMKASKSLRTGRGSVLAEVLRELELRAVGYDGAAGDNTSRGGGHYRQVSKVRSFLEGYRRAEVRRLARETATMLLDRLVSEGIEGLDIALATMTRSSDETSDEAGELNDSLLDYLNDVIRQQEKKVEQFVDSVKKVADLEKTMNKVDSVAEEDAIEKLWFIDTSEEGERVEVFDPNNKRNQMVLKEELERQSQDLSPVKPVTPKSAPEQLLLLLKLLRERIKTEAVFSHDEKSRNLRVLAYCLKLTTDTQRKELIMREFGSSLDRLDSFAELVASSVEYAESTSHQLQPAKQGPLNVSLLKRIRDLTKEIRDVQAWRSSGVKTP